MRRPSPTTTRWPTRLAAMFIVIGVLGVAAAVANNYVWVWGERNPLRPELIILSGGVITTAKSDPRRDPRVPSLSQTWTWHRGGVDEWPVWMEQMHLSYRAFWWWPIPAVIGIAGLAILARLQRAKRQRDQGAP